MMKITNRRAMALLAAGLLLPGLAACSRSASEDPPVPVETNDDAGAVENAPVEEAPEMVNEAEPMPTPMANMAEAAPPPPPERSADQQMMDDASATGMTARVQRTPSDAPAEDAPPKDGQ